MLHWLNTDWYVTIDHTIDRLCIDWSMCRSIYLSICPFIYLKTFPANPTLKSTSLKQNQKEFSYSWLRKQRRIHQPPKCSEKNKSPNLGIGSVFFGGGLDPTKSMKFFFLIFVQDKKNSSFFLGGVEWRYRLGGGVCFFFEIYFYILSRNWRNVHFD